MLAAGAAGGASTALTVGVRAGALRVQRARGRPRAAGQGRAGRDLRLRHLRARRHAGRRARRAAHRRARASTLGAPITLYLEPGAGLRVRRRRRPAASRRPQGSTDMARIDLDLAHAYKPNPQSDERLRAAAAEDELSTTAAPTRCSGPSGCGKTTLLNIVSGLRDAVAGQREVRRRRRHRAHAAAAQHRPGVPVPGHLRHDDRGREPRLPAAQSRRARPSRSRSASARSPRCSS